MQDDVSLLFREVADLAPSERERYFDQHQVASELRAEIESLLKFDSSDEAVLQMISAAAEEVLESRDIAALDLRCGPYRLVRLLGRGGTGEVFLAERADGQIEQRVAIKFLRPGTLRRSFLARFLQERQILATLQHPGIARLLDASQTSDGRPYLVLDYIDGVPIDEYSRKLDVRGKLLLFLKVCDAVAYAHRNLIIHRDLKPSNILVTADGEPKLLDFGIAKILDSTTDQTRTQERILTPDYASPEQVRGAIQSTATDVYSLGAVLYQLLTGKSPHSFSDRTLEAAICATEPVSASSLNPSLPRDLDFILFKALRKQAQDRYSSVEAMADDVRAFLGSRPIRARSGNTWYRTRKFVQRYRTAVAAAALTITALSAGLYVANRQRLIAQERFQQLRLLSAKVFDLDARIKQLPGSTEARHELVSMSLDYLERLSASARGDLDLAQEIGAAYMRVARIQGVPTDSNLGDAAGAEVNLAKADRWLDQVLESRKTSAAALILSAGVAQDRMIVADSQRRKSDAKIHSSKAVERLDQLSRLGNLTPQQRYDAARYYANIAISANNLHQYELGRRYATKSIEVVVALPQEPKIRAGALSLIGSSLRSEGRLEEALDALQQARQVAESATFSNPTERAMDMYGILLREARTLGQDGGVSLDRTAEAIAVYQRAVDLMEDQSSKDSRDQNARDRLAMCSRELAELLADGDPRRSLAVFDLGIHRLREVKNNPRARRREAQALAESSYPLRRLNRFSEARQRIDAAFALLHETKDDRTERINPDSEIAAALRAQADYQAEAGDRRRAAETYERLLTAMMATNPDTLGDLADASKISSMYLSMAGIYRRAGDSAKAGDMDERRLQLWHKWDAKLPNNGFVQRQLTTRSESISSKTR